MTSRFCTECGAPNTTSAQFCLTCGTPLTAATPADIATGAVPPVAPAPRARRSKAPLVAAVIGIALVAGAGAWYVASDRDTGSAAPLASTAAPAASPSASRNSNGEPAPPAQDRSTGTYTGYMGGDEDPHAQYAYRLRLKEARDGSVTGTIWQREGELAGVEVLDGERAGDLVSVRGVYWKWADSSRWSDSTDEFELDFSAPGIVTGKYRCSSCNSMWYSMNPVRRVSRS